LDGLDFVAGLRQAGLDGTIRFWGRMNRNTSEMLNKLEPLISIDNDHWRDFEFDAHSVIASNDNFETATCNLRQSGNRRNGGFIDIHINLDAGQQWLMVDADKYKGTHEKWRPR